MKKILLTLGAITSTIAPLAAVISCGNGQKTNTEVKKQDIEISTSQSTVWDGIHEGRDYVTGGFTEEYTPHKQKVHDGETPTKPAHASDFDIEEDGLYLVAKDYHGQLWNSETLMDGDKLTDNIVSINSIRFVGMRRNVVQFGDGDSFYAMYNEDDNDGLSVNNLLSTFGFQDTSIMTSTDISKINEKFGVKRSGWGSTVPLKPIDESHGALGNYIGSQNNHVGYGGYASNSEFQSAVKRFVQIYGIDHEVVTSIFNYYGLSKTLDANGDYMDSDSTNGHASRGFAPVVQLDPVLTYEIIDRRTVQFTWHIKEFSTTAANFMFNGKKYGTLSIGDKREWDAYIRHEDSRYQGIRPEYITNHEHTSQTN